jgi:hypothetical protein
MQRLKIRETVTIIPFILSWYAKEQIWLYALINLFVISYFIYRNECSKEVSKKIKDGKNKE